MLPHGCHSSEYHVTVARVASGRGVVQNVSLRTELCHASCASET
jgi:hypothetical protein